MEEVMTTAVLALAESEVKQRIELALHEGMDNVVMACLSENLKPEFSFIQVSADEITALWRVVAKTEHIGRTFTITADVPIRFPDEANGGYRIDDQIFAVHIDDYGNAFEFQAWCECNPHNFTHAIVRQVGKQYDTERWLVGEAFEREVLYRGAWKDLPHWVKQIVAEKWSHLPHVSIDTEKRAAHRAMDFARFRSQGTQ